MKVPIDASIYSQIQQPKPVNLLAQYADVMNLQGAQQQQRLNQMRFDAAQREQDETNALNRIYAGALNPDGTLDRNKLFTGAAGANLGSKIPALQKSFADADAATVKVDSEKFTLAKNRYDFTQKAFGALANDPNLSKDLVLATAGEMVKQGIVPEEFVSRLPQALPDDPRMLRQELQRRLSTQLSAEQILTTFAPKAEKIDNGASISFRDTNPLSATYGQNTAGTAVQKEQSPDSRASVGASMANAAATREVAAATREAARIKANQDTEMKLADDYRAQSKNFKETADAYKQITAVLDKATTSPVATLAGATKFMKMIDPGSVVRESELGMAMAASGVFDRAANYVNTLRNGKVLTAQQVKDFKDITKQIYGAAQAVQQQVDAHYSNQAKQYGLRPEMIIQQLGQSDGTSPKAGGVINFGDLK